MLHYSLFEEKSLNYLMVFFLIHMHTQRSNHSTQSPELNNKENIRNEVFLRNMKRDSTLEKQ